MRILPDSHILAWFAEDDPHLTHEMRDILEDEDNELFFSSASIWELTIKRALNRRGFNIEPHILYRALLDNGFEEMPVNSRHAFVLETLPSIHKDPFDRILIAQSMAEGMLLLTSDETIAQYKGPIRLVR
ncbi:PIN domain nuclease, a component of toxin-antitoxin system (PIN domain) [Xaviernesmea oryzae]|uniref:PIN domain nuclease, a component of toxin-antitoxin system (PIN domain) n=1 Tax=Xaviernesmea oryzae TaxID=464029 RepID=A0A1X7EVH6_9HYPH|nr:type II toxin-antitoxin system VapC family toxin [Xaviernesmea oryzae]SMF40734.1 PIN domain nuclease, a component of toxin-antitoxin system (PIN domain) [Xaviernesmea oryzae]